MWSSQILARGPYELVLGAVLLIAAAIWFAGKSRRAQNRRRPQRDFYDGLALIRKGLDGKRLTAKTTQHLRSMQPASINSLLRVTSTLRLRTEPQRLQDAEQTNPPELNFAEIASALLLMRLERRREIILDFERQRGSRVLAIVHERDWGFERRKTHTYFDQDTADELLSVLNDIDPDTPLDIILHTPGGATGPGLQIARALKAHPGPITAFIPFYAYSLGTMIALVADKVVMGNQAVLGPIDPQLGPWPAVDLIRLTQDKPKSEIGDQILMLSYHAERALKEDDELCDLISSRHKQDGTCALVARLASGELSHSYPIASTKARELGINVSDGVPKIIYEYVELCRDIDREPAVRHLDSP